MDCFKKFYTLNRICTLRNRANQSIRQIKKFEKSEFPVAVSRSSLLLFKKHEKFKSNLPVFKVYQCEINSSAVKYFSSDNIDLSRYLISTFEVRNSSISYFDMVRISYQTILILFYDRKFQPGEFTESAEQAARIVSKLIAEKKLSELENLVTSECLSRLSENIDNWAEADREDIAIAENDYVSIAPYDCKIVKEENRLSIEVSMLLLIIKNLKDSSIPKEDSIVPMPDVLKTAEEQEKVYGANYRFIRYYYDKDSSSDWIINGINHFKLEKRWSLF